MTPASTGPPGSHSSPGDVGDRTRLARRTGASSSCDHPRSRLVGPLVGVQEASGLILTLTPTCHTHTLCSHHAEARGPTKAASSDTDVSTPGGSPVPSTTSEVQVGGWEQELVPATRQPQPHRPYLLPVSSRPVSPLPLSSPSLPQRDLEGLNPTSRQSGGAW